MRKFKISLLLVLTFVLLLSTGEFEQPVNASTVNTTLEQNKKFRSEMGLKQDLDHIKNVMKSQNANKEFGVNLTSEEAKELNKRIDVQNEVVPKLYNYLINSDEKFAGIYVDQQEGGVVNILLTDEANANVNRDVNIRKIHGNKLGVNYIKAKYSSKTLESYQEKVYEFLVGKKVNFSTSIEVKENKISIQIENLKESDIETIKGFLPSDSFEIKELEGENVDDNRDALTRPLQGGLVLEKSNGTDSCSSGFIAYDKNYNYYLVTAGHCGSDVNYQGGSIYGAADPWLYQYGGAVDARAFLLSNPAHRGYYVYHYVAGDRRLESYSTSYDSSYVGQSVCKAGFATKATCGVVESTQESGTWGGVPFKNLIRASYYALGGDSGGTVYSGTKLLGIHKGRREDNKPVYSEVSNITYMLGLTPYVY